MEKKVGLFINSASSPFYVPRLELAYIMTFKKKKKNSTGRALDFFYRKCNLIVYNSKQAYCDELST